MNWLILPSKDNGYRPPVKSKSFTQPGKNRGVRLVVYDSLMTHLDGLPDGDGREIPHESVD